MLVDIKSKPIQINMEISNFIKQPKMIKLINIQFAARKNNLYYLRLKVNVCVGINFLLAQIHVEMFV